MSLKERSIEGYFRESHTNKLPTEKVMFMTTLTQFALITFLKHNYCKVNLCL